MLVREVIERISFNIATLNDLSGKSTNNLFTQKQIVFQLNSALDKYASKTLALQGIYSTPFGQDLKWIDAPPRALRSRTYKSVIAYVDGRIYCMRDADWALADMQFPYEITGIPRYFLPWQDRLYIYPSNGNDYSTTYTTADISKIDTTIPVQEVGGNFPQKMGIFTIGDEKVMYQDSDSTNFYGCVRGFEDTIASAHTINTLVSENNLHFLYYKLHFLIEAYDNNIIAPEVLNREMEVCDEHIEMITDYTSYKLLSKVDANRAAFYKVNFDEWLESAKYDVAAERSRIQNGGDINYQYRFQTDAFLGYFV